MSARAGGGTITAMLSPTSSRESLASLLIVYVNSSVGVELAQRLFDVGDVSIAPAQEAVDGLVRGWEHDVIIACPYLGSIERAALHAAIARQSLTPALVEIHDRVCPPGAYARVTRNGKAAELDGVLAALALPLEA